MTDWLVVIIRCFSRMLARLIHHSTFHCVTDRR